MGKALWDRIGASYREGEADGRQSAGVMTGAELERWVTWYDGAAKLQTDAVLAGWFYGVRDAYQREMDARAAATQKEG